MNTLKKYWGTTSDEAKKTNIARKSAQLHLNAQRAVLDSEARVEAAKAKLDNYVTKSVSATEPNFMAICELAMAVEQEERGLQLIKETQTALFG